MRTTGRRPRRSESAPRTGEKRNCIAAHTVPKSPKVRAARAVSPPSIVSTSFGRTGTIIPSASMSRTTVMKMKTSAARRGAGTATLSELDAIADLDRPRRDDARVHAEVLPRVADDRAEHRRVLRQVPLRLDRHRAARRAHLDLHRRAADAEHPAAPVALHEPPRAVVRLDEDARAEAATVEARRRRQALALAQARGRQNVQGERVEVRPRDRRVLEEL